jgi:hypothetical protein
VYPPPTKQPEVVTFDKPAVPNPGTTAEAHAQFRRMSRTGLIAAAVLLVLGGAVYWGTGIAHADDGRAARGLHPGLKGLDLSPEEMERRVREAENGKGAGNYTVVAVKR